MSDFDGDDSSRSLLSKADDFLKRRRAQLGNPMTEATARVEAEDDIPVLTEVVSPIGITANTTAAAVAEKDFNADVAHEMDAWLDENLPQVLIAEIHESARTDLLPRLKRTLSEDKDSDEK